MLPLNSVIFLWFTLCFHLQQYVLLSPVSHSLSLFGYSCCWSLLASLVLFLISLRPLLMPLEHPAFSSPWTCWFCSLSALNHLSCSWFESALGRSLGLCLLFAVTLFSSLIFVPWSPECSFLSACVVHELCCFTATFWWLFCSLPFLWCSLPLKVVYWCFVLLYKISFNFFFYQLSSYVLLAVRQFYSIENSTL